MPPRKTKLPTEELRLWKHYARHHDDDTRNALAERFAPLVYHQAKLLSKRLPNSVTREEMVIAGMIGLMQAIASFDLSRGLKFSTYAPQRIRGAIMDWLREMDWVPRLVRTRGVKLQQARDQLEHQLKRPASDGDLAKFLEVSLPTVEAWQREATVHHVGSLDAPRHDSEYTLESVTQRDLIKDRLAQSPARPTQRQDLMKMVTKGCNKDERLILILYYFEELTMRQIGETLNLSESRVSQMHSALVLRLKTRLAGRESEFT